MTDYLQFSTVDLLCNIKPYTGFYRKEVYKMKVLLVVVEVLYDVLHS